MSLPYGPLVHKAISFCQEKPSADSFCCCWGSNFIMTAEEFLLLLLIMSPLWTLLTRRGCSDKPRALLARLQPCTLQQRCIYPWHDVHQQNRWAFAGEALPLSDLTLSQSERHRLCGWKYSFDCVTEQSLLLVAQLGFIPSGRSHPFVRLTGVSRPA